MFSLFKKNQPVPNDVAALVNNAKAATGIEAPEFEAAIWDELTKLIPGITSAQGKVVEDAFQQATLSAYTLPSSVPYAKRVSAALTAAIDAINDAGINGSKFTSTEAESFRCVMLHGGFLLAKVGISTQIEPVIDTAVQTAAAAVTP